MNVTALTTTFSLFTRALITTFIYKIEIKTMNSGGKKVTEISSSFCNNAFNTVQFPFGILLLLMIVTSMIKFALVNKLY